MIGSVLDAIVSSSPALYGAYLERLDRLQERLTSIVRERGRRRGEQIEGDDPLSRALVGAAVACLKAAILTAPASVEASSLKERLDAVMEALRPAAG